MYTGTLLWLAEALLADDGVSSAEALVEEASERTAETDLWNTARVHHALALIRLWQERANAANEELARAIAIRHLIQHRKGLADSFEVAGWAAADIDAASATRFLGVAASLREILRTPLASVYRGGHEHYSGLLRTKLGSRYQDRWASGRRLPLVEAVQLATNGRAVAPSSRQLQLEDGLTSRELEIAGLVATGATNRQIAAELVISDQTAKFHVHNILAKLGFRSRSEIASWYTRQRLG
jgi:non-specific serine/threonine protein kinase